MILLETASGNPGPAGVAAIDDLKLSRPFWLPELTTAFHLNFVKAICRGSGLETNSKLRSRIFSQDSMDAGERAKRTGHGKCYGISINLVNNSPVKE
ncbi:hypothetical protein VNO78_00627 [Psophocarpus tetragonolobus]|uniref:Uncharacterized protein n=1 Tax=Psophocarpus tetragonolobus TaxID=3891 RepID=A0AAN9XU76_PSOTE